MYKHEGNCSAVVLECEAPLRTENEGKKGGGGVMGVWGIIHLEICVEAVLEPFMFPLYILSLEGGNLKSYPSKLANYCCCWFFFFFFPNPTTPLPQAPPPPPPRGGHCPKK